MNGQGQTELFQSYDRGEFFDEMIDARGEVLAHYRKFDALVKKLSPSEFEKKERSVSLALLRQGVTFNVYGDSRGTERIFPFDLVPRIVPAAEAVEERVPGLHRIGLADVDDPHRKIIGKRRRRLVSQNFSKSRWPDRRNSKKLTPRYRHVWQRLNSTKKSWSPDSRNNPAVRSR